MQAFLDCDVSSLPAQNMKCVVTLEQSNLEANNEAGNEEIPRLFWSPNVHYRVYKVGGLANIL